MAVIDFILNATMVFGGVMVLIITLLYFFQNKILYLPVVQGLPQSPSKNPVGYRSPLDRGLPFQDVSITTSDNLRLHGWILKQEKSKEVPTVLYFHENAGNIGTRIFFMEEYFKQGLNVMLIAYRGYSDSEGEPTEQGLELDAQAILKHIFNREDIDNKKIFIHGRSLGGAVGIYSASVLNKYQIAGLIAENTFTSIGSMVDVIFPKLKVLKPLLLKNHWPSADRIGQVKCPIHFVFSMKDELVPPKHMAELFDKATGARFKSKFIVEEANHNNTWTIDPINYFNSLNKFIDRCLQENQESVKQE